MARRHFSSVDFLTVDRRIFSLSLPVRFNPRDNVECVEVEVVCSRAIVIAAGKIVADCSPAELEAQSSYHNAITIRVGEAQGDACKGHLDALDVVARVESNGLAGNIKPVDRNGSCRRRQKTRDHTHGGGFPGAVGAKKSENFTSIN